MGEEFEVTIEKGKTLAIKTLTPGIEVKKKILVGGEVYSWIIVFCIKDLYSISFLLGYFRVEF